MTHLKHRIVAGLLIAVGLGVAAHAQQPTPPPFATTKVDGADNVYIFRNGNHQSMFVVTSAGVIATDPVAYGRPTGGADLCGRDPQGHQPADQVPDLQPPPLRPYRRRQGVQGRRRDVVAHKRAQERLAAPEGPAHDDAG